MHFSIRAYKAFGMAAYYGAIGLFWLIDRHYQTDGIFTTVGYCYGLAFLVGAFIVSTGEQRLADIQAELNGGAGDNTADKLWGMVDRVVFWGSILAAVYFFRYSRFWDALASLGFPAWRLWLVAEIRRLKIKSGELRPSGLWKVALACSAAFTFLMLALMLFSGYGPYKNLGLGEFQLYPALFITGIVSSLLCFLGTGANLD